jgi:hypothetical protein
MSDPTQRGHIRRDGITRLRRVRGSPASRRGPAASCKFTLWEGRCPLNFGGSNCARPRRFLEIQRFPRAVVRRKPGVSTEYGFEPPTSWCNARRYPPSNLNRARQESRAPPLTHAIRSVGRPGNIKQTRALDKEGRSGPQARNNFVG